MAIDRTGISSLDAGAGEITYSGNEGPKSPDQQLMAQADPMLVEMYQQYVFEMEEQGLQPMSFKEFLQQAVSGMAEGGIARLGYANGQRVGFRVGKGAGMERTSDTGMAAFGPPDRGGPPGGGDPGMTYTPPPPTHTGGDGPPPKDVWNVGTPSKTFNSGLSEQRNRLYNIRQRQLKNYLEGDEDREMKKKVDDWFNTEPKSTDTLNFADVSASDINRLLGTTYGTTGKQKYAPNQDIDTIRTIEGPFLNPTITDQEIRDVLNRKITEPTGIFAAEGGIARLGYANGQLVQPGPGRPGYAGNRPEGLNVHTQADREDIAREVRNIQDAMRDQGSGATAEDYVKMHKHLEDPRRHDPPEVKKTLKDKYNEWTSDTRKKSILKNMYHIAKGRPIQPALMAMLQGTMTEEDFEEKFGISIDGLVGLSPMEQTNIFGDMSQFDKDRLSEMAGIYGQDYVSQDDWTKAFYGPKGPPDLTGGGDDPILPNYYAPRDVHPGTGGITDATGTTTSDWDVASLDLPFDRSGPKHDFSSKYFYGADGGRPGYAGGGDVRQGYFLGKLVKKAGKALKKVAKSPIGKAALLYGLGSIGGSYGLTGKLFSKGMLNPMNMKAGLFGANSLMMNKLGMGEMAAKKGLLANLGLTSGYGGMMPTALGGILGASALGGLYTASNEDEDENEMYNKWLAEKNKWLSGMGDWNVTPVSPLYQRSLMAADGGRIGYKFGNRVDDLVDNTGIKDIGLEQQVKARMEIFNEDYDTALQKVLESIGKSTDNIISGTEVMEPSDLGMNIIRDTGVTPNFASLPKMKKLSYAPDNLTISERKPRPLSSSSPYLSVHADGGRIGYDNGGSASDRYEAKIKELMDKGLSRALAETIVISELSPEAYTILDKKDGGRIGYAKGGDHTDRQLALNTIYGIRAKAQEGGLMDMGGMEKDYRNEGGFVPIGGQERADDVPARLSKNEFVFTADAVRNAGGGDIDKGAEIMENLMENLENGGKVSEESQGLEGARNMFATSQRLEGVL